LPSDILKSTTITITNLVHAGLASRESAAQELWIEAFEHFMGYAVHENEFSWNNFH
jgi:hypothetical protein